MLTVLVVEDDALIRMGAISIVENAGFVAVDAASADQAIAILEARPDIHLVFTDVDMPGSMDGLKLAHYVRKRWPAIRLVVASGKNIVTESELPQGSRFFAKPYADGAIARAIVELLA